MTASPGRRRVAGKADGVADGPVHARQPTRAEEARTRRRGLAEPPRATLFRLAIEAAAGAGTEQEFFDRMAAAGVRVRLIHDIAGAVTEYAAGLRGDVTLDGGQAWHGGRQLAPGLSLPRLRRQWTRRQQGRRIPPARRRGELRDAGAHCPWHTGSRGPWAAHPAAMPRSLALRRARPSRWQLAAPGLGWPCPGTRSS
jgi:hypothetical protein